MLQPIVKQLRKKSKEETISKDQDVNEESVDRRADTCPLPWYPGGALRGHRNLGNMFNCKSTPYVHYWSIPPLIIDSHKTSSGIGVENLFI